MLAWLHEQLGASARDQGCELTLDSRRVLPGDVFLAIKGGSTDGRDYIARAISQGARAVIYEARQADAALPLAAGAGVPMLAVEDLASQVAALAAAYYGHPSRHLKIVAVTGTNGKTSCSQWIAQGLQMAGWKVAVVGTLGARVLGEPESAIRTGLTTPDAVALQSMLARFVRQGVQAVAMEASSIGLDQGRMDELAIDTAVFTNLSQDHLDYHKTMQAYLQAKLRLFRWPGLRSAVINADDDASGLVGAALSAQVERLDYSLDSSMDEGSGAAQAPATLRASDIAVQSGGMSFAIALGAQRATVSVPMIGRFNVSNLLAVVGAWLALGLSFEQALDLAARLSPVAGRMQLVSEPGKPLAIIDYAHTPDALRQILATLRPAAQQRGGRLWVVFGAGGDRDAGKRPLMAAIAEELADHLVLTSDNPRSESPFRILSDLRAGLHREPWLTEQDRGLAIERALAAAGPDDLVVIAGKGHEQYQEIGGQRLPFSDLEAARQALAQRLPRDLPAARQTLPRQATAQVMGRSNA